MKNLKLKLSLAILLLILIPNFSFANAGTPLMWLSLLHLAIGNFFIGILEGSILSKIFYTSKVRTSWIMILANYFSAFVGAGAIYLINKSENTSIGVYYFNHLRLTIIILYLVLFIVTVIVEIPFIKWITSNLNVSFRKLLISSLLIQSISYLLITPLYFLSTSANIGSNWKVVKKENLNDVKGYLLYLDSKKSTLNKIKFENLNTNEVVEHIPEKYIYPKIYFDLTTDEKINIIYKGEKEISTNHRIENSLKLKTYVNINSTENSWKNEFKKKVNKSTKLPPIHSLELDDLQTCWLNVADYHNDTNEWKVRYVGTWPIEGIAFENKRKEEIRLAVETPPFAWSVRCPTVLAGDNVIFEIGPHLVLANVKNRELTWLAYGKFPIVVLEK